MHQIYLLSPGNRHIFLLLQLTEGLELGGSLLHLVSSISVILGDLTMLEYSSTPKANISNLQT